MCTKSCIEFGKKYLGEQQITGLKVVEVGAYNVNGSLREHVMSFKPASYLGIDIVPGPGVDQVCSVEQVVEKYGEGAFNLVVCTEMLEHVKDWRLAIMNLKLACAIGGTILLTTVSKGFPHHDHPSDYWRFEKYDMRHIFSDCKDVIIEVPGWYAGVLVRAIRTPTIYDLKHYDVTSAP